MTRRLFSLLLLLGLVVPAVAQAPTSQGLLVRIHLFSGRRDPEFHLDDPAQLAELMQVFTAHAVEDPSPEAEPLLAPRLGYRGIEILRLGEGHPSMGNIVALSLRGSRVQVRRKTGAGLLTTHHRDLAAALEAHLLARAEALGHLDAAMLARIHGR